LFPPFPKVSSDLVFRSSDLVFRSSDLVFRSSDLVFRSLDLVFRSLDLVFRSLDLVSPRFTRFARPSSLLRLLVSTSFSDHFHYFHLEKSALSCLIPLFRGLFDLVLPVELRLFSRVQTEMTRIFAPLSLSFDSLSTRFRNELFYEMQNQIQLGPLPSWAAGRESGPPIYAKSILVIPGRAKMAGAQKILNFFSRFCPLNNFSLLHFQTLINL
jgi:hypothetical protein